MSITTSREERVAAEAKLAGTPVEVLERDLAYWSVAKVDHSEAYRVAHAARSQAAELYADAETWQELIAAELHRRRETPRLGGLS